MTRTVLASAAVLAITLGLTGCGHATRHSGGELRQGHIVIGVSLMNLSSEFIVMLDHALENKAKREGIELLVNDAERSADKQVRQVENFAAQGVDAIILNPCEVEASSPAVSAAAAAAIPVVNVNSETRSAPTAFVGSRDEESAHIAIEFIANKLGGHGNVLMIDGFMGQAAQLKRERGAREALAKYPGLHLLAEQTAEWDRAKAMTLMENWIQSYGSKVDAVFAQNDEMAMGALMALEQAGLKTRVIVVGVDSIADALHAVQDGRLDATIFQDARGQAEKALDTALRIIRKQPFDKETYIPFQLVTKENVARYLK
jgi:inositol transport system substrate-binding protein